MTRSRIAAAWIGLQLLFFLGLVAREEARATSGVSILVRVVPVDPRDLLRGQFINLGYRFSRPWDSTTARARVLPGRPMWAVLRLTGQFHEPARIATERPTALGPGEVAIQGHALRGGYVFGVERYFVPEGTDTPPAEDLTVRLRVDPSGVARIEQVYRKSVPWP